MCLELLRYLIRKPCFLDLSFWYRLLLSLFPGCLLSLGSGRHESWMHNFNGVLKLFKKLASILLVSIFDLTFICYYHLRFIESYLQCGVQHLIKYLI